MLSIHSQGLPLPSFYDEQQIARVWDIQYCARARDAKLWAADYDIQPSLSDQTKIGLLLIDVQNAFCIPDFDLFVSGASGMAAVEDNQRLCSFIYRHLDMITDTFALLNTHLMYQQLYPSSLHKPFCDVSNNEKLESSNVRQENKGNRYGIEIDEDVCSMVQWPYSGLLAGEGHSLVSSVEEALFFHSMVRQNSTYFSIKGDVKNVLKDRKMGLFHFVPWIEKY
ncbi:hypothetical protein DID78_06700, partial [Candidatus Marinamargulisbacteria bacterium SCGC AG-343-D04]